MAVPKDLMDMLACPKCKGSVSEKEMFVVCESCNLAYPVLEGDVPDLLIADSWQLEKAKTNKFKHGLTL